MKPLRLWWKWLGLHIVGALVSTIPIAGLVILSVARGGRADAIMLEGWEDYAQATLTVILPWITLSCVQWVILRTYLPRAWRWIVVGTLTGIVGSILAAVVGAVSVVAAGFSVEGPDASWETAHDPLGHGILAVTTALVLTSTLGVGEWLLLRRAMRHASWWLVGVFLATLALYLVPPVGQTNLAAWLGYALLTGLGQGAITGAAFVAIIHANRPVSPALGETGWENNAPCKSVD
jgi:hypothetical protein